MTRHGFLQYLIPVHQLLVYLVYCKSPIKPLVGAYLFQTHLRGVNRDGDLFNFAKMMVSVILKELECKVEKLISNTVGGHTSSW